MAKLRKLTPAEEERNKRLGLGEYAKPKPAAPATQEDAGKAYDTKRAALIAAQRAANQPTEEELDLQRRRQRLRGYVKSYGPTGLDELTGALSGLRKKKK